MEAKLSDYMETLNLFAPEQVVFRRAFSTIDHIFTRRCLIVKTKGHKMILHCCFVDFRKAFDIVPRVWLFDRLKSLKQVSGCVRCPSGLSNCFRYSFTILQKNSKNLKVNHFNASNAWDNLPTTTHQMKIVIVLLAIENLDAPFFVNLVYHPCVSINKAMIHIIDFNLGQAFTTPKCLVYPFLS